MGLSSGDGGTTGVLPVLSGVGGTGMAIRRPASLCALGLPVQVTQLQNEGHVAHRGACSGSCVDWYSGQGGPAEDEPAALEDGEVPSPR